MGKKVVKLKESDIKDLIKKIIEEQVNNVSADVGTIMRELENFNTDEQAIVNIIKKYKTLAELQSFFTQYKTISGKDFGNAIGLAFKVPDDNTEIMDLKNHLKTVGIGLEASRQGWTITGLTPQVSAEDAAKVETMWADPKVSCVVNQPNAKKEILANGSVAYLIGPVRYYANGRKQLPDGTITNYNCSTEFKTTQQQTQQRQRRQPDPKVQELQKTLVGTVVNGRKFTEADVDGVMGPITRAAQAAKQGTTTKSAVPGLPPGVTEDDILKRAEEIEKARAAAPTPAPKTT
jgi:hypothetical protein